ncbi:YceI family protein [Paludibacter propionicigenes WB4]|uniref:YceI family protein n=1 Tax=Paludibacter propionicigenes (strain DSM 17365 / JCM 13257 / WB4) TaxID=694427 RepID=E4T7R4_PALPW|nr:YceI family protein [Paludibacter propionicigenes]ADQ80758.1 YceI family protein [Paludibacter propionicigenes WB4]
MLKTKLTKFHMLLMVSGILAGFTGAAKAQTLKINPQSSTMTISGTTNVHNFQSKVTQMSGELVISGKKVQSLKVDIPVKSIKSNEKLMDSKTYEAFNAEKNPTITFQLTDAVIQKATAEDIDVAVTGNLTMAGVTKKITFNTTGKALKPGTFQFTGSVGIKMTDYKMKPPTAMLGIMKVGDAITLKFSIVMVGDPEVNALLTK